MSEPDNTSFLYPFIESEETDAASLLDDLAASARGKAAESARLQGDSLDEYGDALTAAGASITYREIANLSHTYPREENMRILDWLLQ